MSIYKMAKEHKWIPENYNNHSSIQYTASMELLEKYQMKGGESIIDIGCGDGKITAEIAKRVPLGRIHGIDISSEMIRFAKEHFSNEIYLNLTFDVEDANKLNYFEKFDVVFSSFALQWIKNCKFFLKKSVKSLLLGGHIVFTIPLGISEELEVALTELLKNRKWKGFFSKAYQLVRMFRDIEWKQAIEKSQLELVYFDRIIQKSYFSSFSSLKNYITQWLPHIYLLPCKLRHQFKKELFYLYLKEVRSRGNLKECFSFPRLDIVAKKVRPVSKTS